MKAMKKVVLALGMTVMVAGLSSQVMAHGDRDHGPMHRMLAKLELTDAQQTSIDALISDFQAANPRPDRDAMQEKRAAMKAEKLALITAADFDEAAVRAKLNEFQQQMQDRMVAKLRLKHDIYQQLTPEQQETFQAMMEKMDKYGKGRFGRGRHGH